VSNIDKYKALGATAVSQGVDMTKSVAGGGGDYTPPAEGPARCRFVGYVELGKQKGTFQGKPNVKEKVLLIFELSGPKHQPTVNDDGTKTPIRITIEENLSLNEKANFFKLFTRMNYAGGAQHMVQLLGEAFKCRVVHDKWEDRSGKERITPILRDAAGYTIEAPRYEMVDPESGPTGEFAPLKVDPMIGQPKAFLWNYSDLEDWNNLFIEGSYPERKDDKGNVTAPEKSKNVLQEHIMRAVNFIGSPIHTLLVAGGATLDIPDAEVPEDVRDEAQAAVTKAANADDALSGVV